MNNIQDYAKGDLRRMLLVLAAIDTMATPTSVSIGKHTGLDKRTVMHLIGQAVCQAGVRIDKQGAVYSLVDWGPLLNKAGAHLAAQGKLGS